MAQLKKSGLLDACDEMIVGINGGEESLAVAKTLIPAKARIVLHGLESRSENLTLVQIEKFCKDNSGWAILYFHSKGVTHTPGTDHYEFVTKWRRGMMDDLVGNWMRCVSDLHYNDICCSLWLWNMADGTQHIPAGNFLFTKSSFVAQLPSIYKRDRIRISGIGALESRFEAETFWGNGRRPIVKQYHPQWQVWRNIL